MSKPITLYQQQDQEACDVYHQKGTNQAIDDINRNLFNIIELKTICLEMDKILSYPESVSQKALLDIEPLTARMDDLMKEDIILREVDEDGCMGTQAIAFFSGWHEYVQEFLNEVKNSL